MKQFILIAVFCLVTEMVFAAPVYLECATTSEDEKVSFSLKIDEDTGKITRSGKAANGQKYNTNYDGFFAPNEITFEQVNSKLYASGIKVFHRYVLNRTDLTITRYWSSEISDPNYIAKTGKTGKTETIVNGFCSIVEVKDKKI